MQYEIGSLIMARMGEIGIVLDIDYRVETYYTWLLYSGYTELMEYELEVL